MATNSTAYTRAWRAANRDKQAIYDSRRDPEARKENRRNRAQRYRKDNAEKVNIYARTWRAANLDKVAGYFRTIRSKRPEILAARLSAWQKKNPMKCATYSENRRARKANALGSHTAAERRERFAEYGWKCAYCLIANATDLDHMTPLSRGGGNGIENMAPSCGPCNSKKGTKTLLETVIYG